MLKKLVKVSLDKKLARLACFLSQVSCAEYDASVVHTICASTCINLHHLFCRFVAYLSGGIRKFLML